MNIVWTAEARRSLRAIQRFIAQDSAFYADRVVSRIIERVEAAARHPGRGHPVHEYLEAPLREVYEASCRIIYISRDETLHVVTTNTITRPPSTWIRRPVLKDLATIVICRSALNTVEFMNSEIPHPDTLKDQFVALTNRHAAAQFEYNTRIQARHTVMNLYLASSTLLIAQVYSKGNFSGNSAPDNDMAIACAFAIPFASLICALLMKMHDDMMGQLHNYMMTCELYGVGAALPGYHVMEPWSSALLKTRKTQNLVMIIVFLSLCGAAGYAIHRLAGSGWAAVGGIISGSEAWIEFTSFKNRQKAAKRARKILGIKEHEPIEWTGQQAGHRFD